MVSAILRGVSFDDTSYNSFLDLQDKLHQNICRRRTLVTILYGVCKANVCSEDD